MQWFVYIENFNAKKIEKYNVLGNEEIVDTIKKAYKKYKNDYDKFCEEVKSELMYHYWSKCEWEIILSDWPPSETFNKEKIDVFDQIMLNKDIFFKYVWDCCQENKNSKSQH